jgi:hypothetical protein
MYTLTNPSPVVIDIRTYPWVNVRDFFLDSHRFAVGGSRILGLSSGRCCRHASPTGRCSGYSSARPRREGTGLRLVASKATGFTDLSIVNGVARVRLAGGCGNGGSTFTIADEIFPTLKQFRRVHWVKIHGPTGHPEHPYGHTDSIPVCLEP